MRQQAVKMVDVDHRATYPAERVAYIVAARSTRHDPTAGRDVHPDGFGLRLCFRIVVHTALVVACNRSSVAPLVHSD